MNDCTLQLNVLGSRGRDRSSATTSLLPTDQLLLPTNDHQKWTAGNGTLNSCTPYINELPPINGHNDQ